MAHEHGAGRGVMFLIQIGNEILPMAHGHWSGGVSLQTDDPNFDGRFFLFRKVISCHTKLREQHMGRGHREKRSIDVGE